MTDDTILIERHTGHDTGIFTVVLNRPAKLNAMTKTMWGRLGEVIRELDADDSLRCIILRGAGEKSFSPGNDIAEFETDRSNSAQAEAYGHLMHTTIEALTGCRHPMVAQIHGICVGGGLEIAGTCDIRICGDGSKFGAPISKLGLVMAYPEMGALMSLVGRNTTMEILLEGRVFDAAEAKDKGIVNRIVPDADVATEALETARRIAAGAPLVHRWHKKFAARMADPTPITADENREGFQCYDTDDFKEGYQAFLEKRTPRFTGR